MSRLVFPRRTFLRGLGGVGLALPLMSSWGCSSDEQKLLEKVGRAEQRAGEFPKRFIFIYTPNGNYTPPTPDLSGYWEELLPLKDKINLLTGLDLAVCDKPPGEPHQTGMAQLTGRGLNAGNFIGGDGSKAGWGSGISVDQELGTHIGGMTKRKTLNLGIQSTNYGGTEVRTVLSYLGSDIPVANETNPWSLYNDLFTQLGSDPAGVEHLRKRRKSVLDAVDKRFVTLNAKVGKADREKLEQHLSSVRDVEKRLDNPGGVIGGACQLPDVGVAPLDQAAFLGDPANYGTIGTLQMDLLAMALTCDLTRVATLQWSAATNNRPYPFLQYQGAPISGDEHNMGHMPDSDTAAWGKIAVIRRWNLQNLMYLLQKLESVPEGDGTMLDNTLVLLGSEIVRGNTHSHEDMHFIQAGSAGGAIKTGQFLNFAGTRPHNDLLVTVLQAMGVDANEFGDPEFNTGPLTELFA